MDNIKNSIEKARKEVKRTATVAASDLHKLLHNSPASPQPEMPSTNEIKDHFKSEIRQYGLNKGKPLLSVEEKAERHAQRIAPDAMAVRQSVLSSHERYQQTYDALNSTRERTSRLDISKQFKIAHAQTRVEQAYQNTSRDAQRAFLEQKEQRTHSAHNSIDNSPASDQRHSSGSWSRDTRSEQQAAAQRAQQEVAEREQYRVQQEATRRAQQQDSWKAHQKAQQEATQRAQRYEVARRAQQRAQQSQGEGSSRTF